MKGVEFAEVRDAITRAFSKGEFDLLLRERLDFDRPAEVADGPFGEVVGAVLRKFEQEGREAWLISAVAAARPLRADIQEIYVKYARGLLDTSRQQAVAAAAAPWEPTELDNAGRVAFLRKVPASPMVPGYLLKPLIVEECSTAYDAAESRLKLDEANALRAEVDPDGPGENMILPGAYREPETNPLLRFWTDVFTESRRKSPRMLAAVLLVVYSPRLRPEVRRTIVDLLLRLRGPFPSSPPN